jgi:hypothetical protein
MTLYPRAFHSLDYFHILSCTGVEAFALGAQSEPESPPSKGRKAKGSTPVDIIRQARSNYTRQPVQSA